MQLAKALHMSYTEVKELPFDEYTLLAYMIGIEGMTRSEEGMEILKTNIRLQQTEPELDKLREKYGGDK